MIVLLAGDQQSEEIFIKGSGMNGPAVAEVRRNDRRGSVERIQPVAKRIHKCKEDGKDLVIVVSAMGHTNDELTAKANAISSNPPQREMDMLLATGEQVSIALL